MKKVGKVPEELKIAKVISETEPVKRDRDNGSDEDVESQYLADPVDVDTEDEDWSLSPSKPKPKMNVKQEKMAMHETKASMGYANQTPIVKQSPPPMPRRPVPPPPGDPPHAANLRMQQSDLRIQGCRCQPHHAVPCETCTQNGRDGRVLLTSPSSGSSDRVSTTTWDRTTLGSGGVGLVKTEKEEKNIFVPRKRE